MSALADFVAEIKRQADWVGYAQALEQNRQSTSLRRGTLREKISQSDAPSGGRTGGEFGRAATGSG